MVLQVGKMVLLTAARGMHEFFRFEIYCPGARAIFMAVIVLAEIIEFSVDSFYIQFHAYMYARQNRMWILGRKSTPAFSRDRLSAQNPHTVLSRIHVCMKSDIKTVH